MAGEQVLGKELSRTEGEQLFQEIHANFSPRINADAHGFKASLGLSILMLALNAS